MANNKSFVIISILKDDFICIFRYDLRLFEDIRWTKKISIFPVGLIGYQSVTSPIVLNKSSKKQAEQDHNLNASFTNLSNTNTCQVIGFSDPWFANRKFPVDMAGFAANVDFILSHPHQSMPYKVGYEEDYFLQSLNVSFSDLEPMAECCTKVYVWHTKTVSKKRVPTMTHRDPNGNNNLLYDTNLLALLKDLEDKGVVRMDVRRGQQIFTCTDVNGCDTINGRNVN